MAVSFSHPNMISSVSGMFLSKDEKTLIKQNLKLLLLTTKTELFGDPYFGTNLKNLIFEQNDVILKDLAIDDIYSAVKTYMAEITLLRKNIEVEQTRERIDITLKYTYNKDGTNDLLKIKLITDEGY